MILIREANEMNKTEEAIRFKVIRKTVIFFEKGDILPSLEYIYIFSLVLDMIIDDLIK